MKLLEIPGRSSRTRRGGPGNLGRVRVRLAAVYAAASLVAVGALALFAAQVGTQRLNNGAMSDLRTQVGELLGRFDPAAPPKDQYDTWIYDTSSEKATPLGQTDTEPPFRTIAQEAADSGGAATDRFSQGGTPYAVIGQRVLNTSLVLVAVSDLSGTHRSIHRLRWRIALGAAAAVVFTSLVAYVLSGWSLRPARRAGEQQRRFLADTAHELRTPLAVIQAAASQTLHRDRPPDEYVRALSEIRTAAERAGATVAELLDLSRLEAGETSLRRSPLRLDLLAEAVAAPHAPAVSVHAGEPIVVDADYGLLSQALDNILRNAVARAGRVDIRVTTDNGQAIVEVTDDGPGFDVAVLPHAFERFRRGTDEQAGAGLGLALVREIAQAHGGHAEAANLPEGGAAVRLSFPV